METAVVQSGAVQSVAPRFDDDVESGGLRQRLGRFLAVTRTTGFGNVVIILFFVAQALDGAFTYIGVQTFGPSIEGNPLLAWLMAAIGPAPALAGAKLVAAGFGIILHLAAVHRAVALLTALYVSAALLPWTLLFIVVGHIS